MSTTVEAAIRAPETVRPRLEEVGRRGVRKTSRTIGQDLVFLTWTPKSHRSAPELAREAYQELTDELEALGAVIVHERIFGDLEVAGGVLESRRQVLGRDFQAAGPPPVLIEGSPLRAPGLAGIHVIGARGRAPRVLSREGIAYGRVVSTLDADVLTLSDVGRAAHGTREAPEGETRRALRTAEALLAAEGWSFSDVARTWFYLKDILDWYPAFNRVRNEEFRRMRLLGAAAPGMIPASTGIEGQGASGGSCILDVLAVRPRAGRCLDIRRLANTRQNEATEYGSAFARGVSFALGGTRYIFVSGTASIDDRGKSVHEGDFDAQTERTLGTVATLLEGAGASLKDVAQATVFLKNPCDARAFERISSASGLSSVPPVSVVADVCRDELLFELDAVAVVPAPAEDAKAGAGR